MHTTLKKTLPATLLTGLLACLLLTPNANAFWGKKKAEEVKNAEKPTAVNIAVLLSSPKEEPYNTALIQALERMKAEKPEGLDLEWTVTENVAPSDAERVLRSVAESGKYDIIWAHSSSFVAADPALVDDFPEIMWVFAGAAHKNKGGNFYHVVTYPHEPAYLAGIIAGMMTKNDTIGAVAAFPFADVSVQVNGFVEGAKSVNKNLKVKMTYIESWYDPTKAKEAALAQIASGADYIYAERFGPFDACEEEGTFAFGQYVDQNDIAPEVVVSSALAFWDPTVKLVVKDWFDHEVNGTPFNAPKEDIIFFMKDGGSGLAPYHGFEKELPNAVVKKVKAAEKKIMSGELVVPIIEGPVQSN
ncbi:MAG: BMP family protein [Kiritimatiellae bacterium]|nr:BMP family protein [Kiritimatiellia bacterium]MDD4737332.1 BMP family protein [Kiritimatiellia bacterium]